MTPQPSLREVSTGADNAWLCRGGTGSVVLLRIGQDTHLQTGEVSVARPPRDSRKERTPSAPGVPRVKHFTPGQSTHSASSTHSKTHCARGRTRTAGLPMTTPICASARTRAMNCIVLDGGEERGSVRVRGERWAVVRSVPGRFGGVVRRSKGGAGLGCCVLGRIVGLSYCWRGVIPAGHCRREIAHRV